MQFLKNFKMISQVPLKINANLQEFSMSRAMVVLEIHFPFLKPDKLTQN
jgi:hypothetical protein